MLREGCRAFCFGWLERAGKRIPCGKTNEKSRSFTSFRMTLSLVGRGGRGSLGFAPLRMTSSLDQGEKAELRGLAFGDEVEQVEEFWEADGC